MGKLLDFMPPNHRRDGLINMVTRDVCYGCTPDLPKLRYAGPQQVFIWDDLKSQLKFQHELGVDQDHDYKVENYSVHTKEHFLPFKNVNSYGKEFNYYLPKHTTWRGMMQGCEGVRGVESAPVQGRLISCSVRTLCLLDEYYINGTMFDRILQPVVHWKDSARVTTWVWMYVNSMDQLGKYDFHEKTHNMFAGITPQPVRRVASGGTTAFEVDAMNTSARVG
jgi:hypothetical protein